MVTPVTMLPEVGCRGVQCDHVAACFTAARCLYRSSADEAREVRTRELSALDKMRDDLFPPVETIKPTGEVEHSHLERPVEAVKDFSGTIDGAGIKAVMFNAKSPVQLITPEIIEGLAAVLLHGAKKYAANNWMRGMSWTTVYGGIQRHLVAFYRGEEIDPESGLPHLHHAACGLMFLSWYANGPQVAHRKFDDRQYTI